MGIFRKLQRGGDRVKISERLLIDSEIGGDIYHLFCSPNIGKVTERGESNISGGHLLNNEFHEFHKLKL